MEISEYPSGDQSQLELSENMTIAPLQRFSCSKKTKF